MTEVRLSNTQSKERLWVHLTKGFGPHITIDTITSTSQTPQDVYIHSETVRMLMLTMGNKNKSHKRSNTAQRCPDTITEIATNCPGHRIHTGFAGRAPSPQPPQPAGHPQATSARSQQLHRDDHPRGSRRPMSRQRQAIGKAGRGPGRRRQGRH